MSSSQTQVNVRLTADQLSVLDMLRGAAGRDLSRAEVLRSLLEEKRRSAFDQRIAEAYDAAGPADEDLAQASATAAGEALTGL